MTQPKMRLHQYLKSARLKKGLTARKLSALSGVSHPHISVLERGVAPSMVKPRTLFDLCKVLGLNYLEMMEVCGHIVTPAKKVRK